MNNLIWGVVRGQAVTGHTQIEIHVVNYCSDASILHGHVFVMIIYLSIYLHMRKQRINRLTARVVM